MSPAVTAVARSLGNWTTVVTSCCTRDLQILGNCHAIEMKPQVVKCKGKGIQQILLLCLLLRDWKAALLRQRCVTEDRTAGAEVPPGIGHSLLMPTSTD